MFRVVQIAGSLSVISLFCPASIAQSNDVHIEPRQSLDARSHVGLDCW